MSDKTKKEKFEHLIIELEPKESLSVEAANAHLKANGIDVEFFVKKGVEEIEAVKKRISNFPKGGIVGESHQGEFIINKSKPPKV